MNALALGKRLRDLRITNGLTQEELANRCELSKGFISQVEGDQTSPSIATLMDILEGLGTDIQTFFGEKPAEKTVFTPDDYFESEDEELGHKITWIVPNSQKNDMEPILVELGEGGRTQELPPHEGEEFGYVLVGTLTLHVDGKRLRVRAGESFSLHPGAVHWVENTGKRKAQLLWVSTPPTF